jgi:hypothetical protein
MIVPGFGNPFEVNARSGAVVESQSLATFDTGEPTTDEGEVDE